MLAEIFALLVSLAFAGVVARAIRGGGLEPRTALLWAGSAGLGIVISITLPLHWLNDVAHAVGVVYPPDLLLAVAVLWLAVLLFDLSVSMGRLQARHTVLAQELSLRALNGEVEDP